MEKIIFLAVVYGIISIPFSVLLSKIIPESKNSIFLKSMISSVSVMLAMIVVAATVTIK